MFYLYTSFLMFHITFDEISTTVSTQFWYKGRYTRYIYTRYSIEAEMLILWNRASAIFYKDRERMLFTHLAKKAHFCSLMN